MLGKRITELRKQKGISQEDLADVLCTTRQAVSKWEREESDPDIDRLKDLASYFGVSIDYLLGYDIESTAVNSFIDRLSKCVAERSLDVSIEEVKSMVNKNSNNFNLLIVAVNYLVEYFSTTRNASICELIVDYTKKAVLTYQPENKFNVTLNDIHKAVVYGYSLIDENELAKAYIKDNKVHGVEHELATCEYKLGNNEVASQIASELFLESVVGVINANTLQTEILLRTNKVEEAYDLAKWCVSFIKSVEKKEGFLLEIIISHSIMKAICERHMGIDYSKTMKFIKDNYQKAEKMKNDSEYLKYYYKEKTPFTVMSDDVKTTAYKGISYFKESEVYEDAVAIYNELFGE